MRVCLCVHLSCLHHPAPLTCRLPPPPAGFHRAFARWAKPFNPLLGETWQAEMPDGSRIFLEQISHHPPISAFELLGPHGLYTFAGQRQAHFAWQLPAETCHRRCWAWWQAAHRKCMPACNARPAPPLVCCPSPCHHLMQSAIC